MCMLIPNALQTMLLPDCDDFLSDSHSYQTRKSSNENIVQTHKRSNQFGKGQLHFCSKIMESGSESIKFKRINSFEGYI